MALKDWFRILNRRWECLLMMGEGESEAGGQGRCGRALKDTGSIEGHARVVCPKLGLWRMGWDTHVGQVSAQDCGCKKTPWGDREEAQEEEKEGEMRSECEGQEREASWRVEVDGGR